MSISIIAAMASNNVIGVNNQLPWHLPQELANFYRLVQQKPVVMGHKTYQSIGKPIKNATNYILSNNRALQIPDCKIINTIETILALSTQTKQEIMIIGGASIYQQFLPVADTMYLTLIEQEFTGDTYFPTWSNHDWQIVNQQRVITEIYPYNLLVLKNQNKPL